MMNSLKPWIRISVKVFYPFQKYKRQAANVPSSSDCVQTQGVHHNTTQQASKLPQCPNRLTTP